MKSLFKKNPSGVWNGKQMNMQMLHAHEAIWCNLFGKRCFLIEWVNQRSHYAKICALYHELCTTVCKLGIISDHPCHPPMPLINIIPCCVPFRPPSTAMTVGIPPVEAECLLEDRKGGNMHPAHTFTRMYIQIPRHFLVYFSNCIYSLKVLPPLVCQIFSRNSRKVDISPRGAGGLWSLPNPKSCKSTFKNLRY